MALSGAIHGAWKDTFRAAVHNLCRRHDIIGGSIEIRHALHTDHYVCIFDGFEPPHITIEICTHLELETMAYSEIVSRFIDRFNATFRIKSVSEPVFTLQELTDAQDFIDQCNPS